MTKITKKDVQYLGQLARLNVADDMAATMSDDLSAILKYVSKLQSVDTKGVEQTSQVTGLVDVWREDVVVSSGISREELLKNAPATKDGYIKVRRVK